MHSCHMSFDADVPDLPAIADFKGPVQRIPRRRVAAWALWDWATQPFNTVILTFVFTALYLTSDAFVAPEIAALGEDNDKYKAAIDGLTADLGFAVLIAGALIALLAPVLGQRADASGRRKAWLGWSTAVLVLLTASLYFVQAAPAYFLLGASIIALGTVVSEIAGVNYNALLVHVSTPSNVGRVSGLGWGMGYIGGIVALVLVVLGSELEWLPSEPDGMAYRIIALGCAVWTIAFAWPLFIHVPEAPPSQRPRVGLIQGYKVLWADLVELWNNARNTLWFLLASAVFRDGLAGIFTFGAIIAAVAFGFSNTEVMLFGIAASLMAGIATLVSGVLDDRLGSRFVIIASLSGITVAGLAIVALRTTGVTVFWIAGLTLSALVGPAQAASRSLLARVTPPGREAEIFGLYATTGRAASFLSPLAWWAFIKIFGATIWGTLGVVLVVAVGLVLMLRVRIGATEAVEAQA